MFAYTDPSFEIKYLLLYKSDNLLLNLIYYLRRELNVFFNLQYTH